MAPNDFEIANLALLRCGVKALIFGLNDGTTEANIANATYASSRDYVLGEFPWPFAMKRATLVVAAGETRTAWAYCYSLPNDCLKARYIHPGTRVIPPNARIPYAIEAKASGSGKILCTDEADAELVYTAKITAVPSYPPEFVDAVAWRMAADISIATAGGAQAPDYARMRYQQALMAAGASAFREAQDDDPAFRRLRVRHRPRCRQLDRRPVLATVGGALGSADQAGATRAAGSTPRSPRTRPAP